MIIVVSWKSMVIGATRKIVGLPEIEPSMPVPAGVLPSSVVEAKATAHNPAQKG